MTTISTSTVATDAAASQRPRSSATRVVPVAAAAALIAGPVLWSAGMLTSPPQETMSDADYISSLSRDLTMTQVSALFLHYGNLTIGAGILAAPSLVRGSRGAWAVAIGALLTAIGFLNVAGMILSDWWNAATGTLLSTEDAVAVFQHVKSASLLPLWNGTELFSMLGPLLVLGGLARAGVLGWWPMPVFVAGVLGLFALGGTAPAVVAGAVLVAFSPFALIGLRVLQRVRVGDV
jgi:hypothetical protein